VAADRMNERVAHLHEPTHPSILRLLKTVSDAAHANKLWVGVCGEMAGDLTLVPLLLGLGIDELSVSATLVPRVKRAVQSVTISECEQLVAEALALDTAAAILALCTQIAQNRYGDLLS
jgi:phosphoenolpyruvate-protein phosphotransferase (PTS system enzyme I)